MKDIFFSTAVVVLLLVILVMQFLTPSTSGTVAGISPEEIRKFAAKLESERLFAQAVDEYQRYLDAAKIPADQHANLLYKIGTLYLDELHDYENALTVFLRIQNFYPQSGIVREAEKRMIRCYEELKRGFDAQQRLNKLTDLKPEDQPAGAMVAKVGDTVFTLEQIENEIAQMPDYMRNQYQTPEKKLEYLKQKVMQEMLYDMALRKEYQKDAEVRKQISDYEKSLLAQRVYQEEAQDKINITENDIDMYYKANPDEFTRPASAKIAHILVDTEEKAKEVKQKLDGDAVFADVVKEFSIDEATKEKNGELGTVMENNPFLPGIGREAELVSRIMQLPVDAISEPLKSAKGYHIFNVMEKQEKTITPFEEAKQLVAQKLSQMRQQEFQQKLIDDMLKTERVKIYEQVILSK